jgi:hypothetical protein
MEVTFEARLPYMLSKLLLNVLYAKNRDPTATYRMPEFGV